MLNEFLLAAYTDTQTKLANRRLVDKLKTFDLDDLVALANGDPTAKLAYVECDGPSNGPQSWLDKYKGSSLFEKAVELEKALLEADAASDAKRTEERESDRTLDAQRDALRMQKRMLDLDLALEQGGGAQSQVVPEAAPVAPSPTGGGTAVEVKQAAVGAFIPEARSTRDTVHPESRQGAGALGGYSVDPADTVTEGLQVNKTAALAKVAAADAAGRLLAKSAAAGFDSPEQALQEVAAAKALAAKEQAHPVATRLRSGMGWAGLGAAAGGLLGSAAGPAAGLGGMAVGGVLGGALGATRKPGAAHTAYANQLQSELHPDALRAEAADDEALALDVQTNPGKYRASRGVAGGIGGGLAGAALGTALGGGRGALVGGGLGALAGGLGGALPRPTGQDFADNAAATRKHLAELDKVAADTSPKQNPQAFYEEVIKRYPQLAGKKKEAEVSANTATVLHSLLNPLPMSMPGAIGARFLTDPNEPGAADKAMRYGALGGGAAGALVGAGSGGLRGMLVGGGLGALGGGVAAHHVAGKVVREHADTATKQAGIAGNLLQGVKTLGTGTKNLATTAHAAGGMPQVAKSFGNVAKNFAQKNPLAATGVAAGAAGLGGMALGRATAPNR